MKTEDLVAEAEGLVAKLDSASDAERVTLHAALHHRLELIRLHGGDIPAHLREIDLELTDEEVEDGFDNMPV